MAALIQDFNRLAQNSMETDTVLIGPAGLEGLVETLKESDK